MSYYIAYTSDNTQSQVSSSINFRQSHDYTYSCIPQRITCPQTLELPKIHTHITIHAYTVVCTHVTIHVLCTCIYIHTYMYKHTQIRSTHNMYMYMHELTYMYIYVQVSTLTDRSWLWSGSWAKSICCWDINCTVATWRLTYKSRACFIPTNTVDAISSQNGLDGSRWILNGIVHYRTRYVLIDREGVLWKSSNWYFSNKINRLLPFDYGFQSSD